MAESKSDPTLDPLSPYHIDSDSYGYNLHREDILNQAKDNYVFWIFRFRAILGASNKIGFIDGTLEEPDPSSPLYGPWKRCDALVKFLLMNSMTEELQKRVMYAGTARKMWEDLRRIFVPNLELKIYELRRRIATIRQDSDSPCACGGVVGVRSGAGVCVRRLSVRYQETSSREEREGGAFHVSDGFEQELKHCANSNHVHGSSPFTSRSTWYCRTCRIEFEDQTLNNLRKQKQK